MNFFFFVASPGRYGIVLTIDCITTTGQVPTIPDAATTLLEAENDVGAWTVLIYTIYDRSLTFRVSFTNRSR